MLRSVVLDAAEKNQGEIEDAPTSLFRSHSDVAPIHLHTMWHYATGSYDARSRSSIGRYYNLADCPLERVVRDVMGGISPQLCLNGGAVRDTDNVRDALITAFDRRYPQATSFEKSQCSGYHRFGRANHPRPRASAVSLVSMFVLTGVPRDYAWGSITAIPQYLGQQRGSTPLAELWFGAHSTAASEVASLGKDLGEYIEGVPEDALGEASRRAFGEKLPYLLKFLAPAAPLSMQVHPNLAQAREGYARVVSGDPGASIDYVDANHKPELVFPLTDFEVLSGLRTSPEVDLVLEGLAQPILEEVRALLRSHGDDVSRAFAHLLGNISEDDVDALASQCAARLEAGVSPSEHSDRIVSRLQDAYPGDRGVIASLFLTPRVLRPGEVMFVPAGVVHAYLDGLCVELMANSDNVLRAGLTPKHIDVPELLKIVDPRADVLMLEAEELAPGVERYTSPVADFELTVLTAGNGGAELEVDGPRIVLAIEGSAKVRVENSPQGMPMEKSLSRGQAAFVPANAGGLRVLEGRVLHAGLPAKSH